MARRIHDLVLKSNVNKTNPPDFSRMKYSFYIGCDEPDMPKTIRGGIKRSGANDIVLETTLDALRRIENKNRDVNDCEMIKVGFQEAEVSDDDDFDIFADVGRDYELKAKESVSESKGESHDLPRGDVEKGVSLQVFMEESPVAVAKEETKNPSQLLQRLEADHELFNVEIIDESDDDFEREFNAPAAEKADGEEKELSRFHFDTEEKYNDYKKTLKRKAKGKKREGGSKKKKQKTAE
jgi:hypothetical protein